MGSFLSKNELPVDGRTILITGGSSGLGLNAACQLAAKGANVIIVARTPKTLKDALEQIKASARSPTQRFHSIVADVTTAAECSRVVNESVVLNDNTPPNIVWCCSGSAHPTLFIDTPIDQFQTMMDSNYFSSVYMAHAILNLWLRPPLPASPPPTTPTPSKPTHLPANHLIFTASFVSFFSFAGFTPYSPSKAAIRSLSDSLSQELNLYQTAHPSLPHVRIHTVFPATMPTASLASENEVKTDLTKMLEEGDTVLSAKECARRAVRGLERGEELVATSGIIRAVMCGMLGGSVRRGVVKGVVDTVLAWVVVLVMVGVRWDMDRKVRRWGREFGGSGMRGGRT